MHAILKRYLTLPAFVLATVAAALAWDLSHVYDAYTLSESNKRLVARVQPLLDQDLARISGCAWPEFDHKESNFPACAAQILPNLKTTMGLYAGTLQASIWQAQHPEDTATKALALKSMDRLWDVYRKEDQARYRMVDEVVDDLNKSVLFRVLYGAKEGQMELAFEQKLNELEVAVNDPVLAGKQRNRTLQYLMEDARVGKPKAARQVKN